ncbi:MAG TPA: hypothetical protein VF550_00250 [Polyangia bacterium]
MEPRPWLEGGATEIEKALLRAGRAEVPRKGADLRILAMIQGASPPTVKPVTFTRWVKVGLVAIVAGGAALVAPQLSRPHAVPASDLSARALGVQTVPLLAAPAEGGTPGKAALAPEVSERLQVQAAREKEPPSVPDEGSRVESRRAKPAGSARDHSLGEETKALDHAREALDEHRPSEVLRLLDEYRRRFPQGRLRPEAMILRLAALSQAGRHEAADSLARQLLSDEAYASYAPRIQSLLREAKQ